MSNSTDTLHIKPASGLNVRDPQTGAFLAVKGEHKPKNSYWLRRLNDGDVDLMNKNSGGKS